MSKADVQVANVEVPCRTCGLPALSTVLVRDGKPGPALPTDCASCANDDVLDASEPSAPRDPEQAMLAYLDRLGVNTRKHGGATIEGFDSEHATLAPGAVRRFVEDTVAAGRHDRVRGLYLVGPTGTGKSHLAVAAIREVHARCSASIVYVPADRLVTRVQDSYGTGGTDALIESLVSPHLLVLDDLGREKPTADALRILCTVLDEREGAPTILTANGLPHELGSRFGDRETWGRLESRLGDEVYRYVRVGGPDRRFARSSLVDQCDQDRPSSGRSSVAFEGA